MLLVLVLVQLDIQELIVINANLEDLVPNVSYVIAPMAVVVLQEYLALVLVLAQLIIMVLTANFATLNFMVMFVLLAYVKMMLFVATE